MHKDQIVGEKPMLEGSPLQALIAQAYWCEGKLVEDANAVWIKQNEQWYHLCFDSSIIFWRSYDDGPSYASPEKEDAWDYPLENLLKKYGLININLESVVQEAVLDTTQIAFKFASGFKIKFVSKRDVTKIEISQG